MSANKRCDLALFPHIASPRSPFLPPRYLPHDMLTGVGVSWNAGCLIRCSAAESMVTPRPCGHVCVQCTTCGGNPSSPALELTFHCVELIERPMHCFFQWFSARCFKPLGTSCNQPGVRQHSSNLQQLAAQCRRAACTALPAVSISCGAKCAWKVEKRPLHLQCLTR